MEYRSEDFFCFKINQVQKINVKLLTFTPTRTLAAFSVIINFSLVFISFLQNSFSKFLLRTLPSANIVEKSVSSEFEGAWLTSLSWGGGA